MSKDNRVRSSFFYIAKGMLKSPPEGEILKEFNVISLKDAPYSFTPVTTHVESTINQHQANGYALNDLVFVYGLNQQTLMHQLMPLGGIRLMQEKFPATSSGIYLQYPPNFVPLKTGLISEPDQQKEELKTEWEINNGRNTIDYLSQSIQFKNGFVATHHLIKYAQHLGIDNRASVLFTDAPFNETGYFKNIQYGLDDIVDSYIDRDLHLNPTDTIAAESADGMRIRNHKLYNSFGHGVAMVDVNHIYGSQDKNFSYLFERSLEGLDDRVSRLGVNPRTQVIIFPLRDGEYIADYIDREALHTIKRRNDKNPNAQPTLVVDGADDIFTQANGPLEEETHLTETILNNSGEGWILSLP